MSLLVIYSCKNSARSSSTPRSSRYEITCLRTSFSKFLPNRSQQHNHRNICRGKREKNRILESEAYLKLRPKYGRKTATFRCRGKSVSTTRESGQAEQMSSRTESEASPRETSTIRLMWRRGPRSKAFTFSAIGAEGTGAAPSNMVTSTLTSSSPCLLRRRIHCSPGRSSMENDLKRCGGYVEATEKQVNQSDQRIKKGELRK